MTASDSLKFASTAGTSLILRDKHLPAQLTLLPVSNRQVFPGQVQPVILKREPWESTLQQLSQSEKPYLGLLFCDEQDAEHIDSNRSPRIGCAVRILRG